MLEKKLIQAVDRRDFIKTLVVGATFILGCGGGGGGESSSSSNVNITQKQIKFGLGDDPEQIITTTEGRYVLETLKPDILCMWINGAKDNVGRVYSPSMDYVRDFAKRGRFTEYSRLGYEIMVITWENYDGQNTSYGQPTKGDYHISDRFLADIEETLSYLSSYGRTVYFALATEQSTYTACRYDCSRRYEYSDRINDTTIEYYSKLRDNLLKAVRLIKSKMPSAQVGISFGGWLIEFKEGLDFIKYFEPVINESNAVFFQSMKNNKSSESNGYGNPESILKNAQFYSKYGKPVHLAHYMPDSMRQDVVADDMERMSNPEYVKTLSKYLSSFSFMRYSLLANNGYDCLTKTAKFRQLLKNI
jgi:hypothetical protein